jgi:hypothetical protein
MRYLLVHFVGPDAVSDVVEATSGSVVELFVGDQSVPPDVKTPDGQFTFTLPEEETTSNILLRVGERDYRLEPGVLERLSAPDVGNAIPLMVVTQPASDRPSQSFFQTRIQPKDLKPIEVPLVAGNPGDDLIPTNSVATKETRNYLEPSVELRAVADWVPGLLYELDTFWEPLGWALDEWIDTISLAPYEDTMHSSADLSTDASARSGSSTVAVDQGTTRTEDEATVEEETEISTNVSAAGRGFQAGVGGTSSGNTTITIDPIASLTRAVTGAVQLGYSSNSFSSSSLGHGDLKREVSNRLEQSTNLDRLQNERAVAGAVGRLRESRRLQAMRNLAGGRALNLAVFSVTRQWLVSTVQARVRPIVFIRAQDLDVPFTPEDVFVHRAALMQALHESWVKEAVERVAKQYVPSPRSYMSVDGSLTDDEARESNAEIMVNAFHGGFTIDDPGKGEKSVVRVRALFRNARGGDDEHFDYEVEASREGEVVEFSTNVDRPLRLLTGWSFEFINPGVRLDRHARLTSVHVELHTSLFEGDPPPSPIQVSLPERIDLPANYARTFARSVRTDYAQAPERYYQSAEVARLLRYLNANLAHYRLAIDLQRDPASRFAELSKRPGGNNLPVDMRPVGVAGTHLAFLSDHPTTSPGDDPEPVRQLLSTPAGGTFMEVLAGHTEISVPDDKPGWPAVIIGEKASLTWPTPVQLPPVSAPQGALEDQKLPSVTKPEPGVSELIGKLAETVGSIEKLTAAVQAQSERTKAAVPALPAPPAGGESAKAGATEGAKNTDT